MRSVTADQARRLILSGQAPASLNVSEDLDFSGEVTLTALPEGLRVRRLVLDNCSALQELPRGLHCYELSAQATPLKTLPTDLQVDYRLDLSHCDLLEEFPDGLKVNVLILRGCTGLRSLPEDLKVFCLDMPGCVGITHFPKRGPATLARLNLRGCTRLQMLPIWLQRVAQLDIGGCASLTCLPETLHVVSWVDIADTPLRGLPPHLQGVQVRWRDVLIDERIAFHPEQLSGNEVLTETNVERRRVMLERLGYERFLADVSMEVLHQDRDPGGVRRLLRVPMSNDEPLVCLDVQCPSTGRRYLIRVPPDMRTCHQAAAWIAGFDDPQKYHPLIEA
jgi:hypothetical protein